MVWSASDWHSLQILLLATYLFSHYTCLFMFFFSFVTADISVILFSIFVLFDFSSVILQSPRLLGSSFCSLSTQLLQSVHRHRCFFCSEHWFDCTFPQSRSPQAFWILLCSKTACSCSGVSGDHSKLCKWMTLVQHSTGFQQVLPFKRHLCFTKYIMI